MTTDEMDRRLTAELGDLAYRMPPSPLAAIHERAVRRRRARLGRRAAGVAGVVLAATAVWLPNRDDGSGDVTPADPRSDEVECVSTRIEPSAVAADLRMLPGREPRNTRFREAEGMRETGCADYSISAWHVDARTSRLDRLLRVDSSRVAPQQGTPRPGTEPCAAVIFPGLAGTCERADVAGASRWVWRTRGPRGQLGVWWRDGGLTWSLLARGFPADELEGVLNRLEVDGDRVVAESLPSGMRTWQTPESGERTELVAYYGVPPKEDATTVDVEDGAITFRVSRTVLPGSDPLANQGGDGTVFPGVMQAVQVNGRPGVWSQDSAHDVNRLWWQGPDGVSMTLEGAELTLADARTVAESVRAVGTDDPRFVCDPATNPWGGCGG